LTYAQALAEAMAEEMRRDESVVVWGCDVGQYGGAFSATRGLFEEFGSRRVIDMPISEAGFTGMAVGAAATGLRPIVELQFSDWITLASDQLINQAAKMRYMFGGLLSIPLVLRAPAGGYLSAGAQHSDSFEAMFAHVPGLKVVYPATPSDAKGLLKSAIRDNNPVVFFEHKKLYGVKGEVPVGEYTIPLGSAEVKRPGSDVTIVAYAYMVHLSLAAAESLDREGVSAEVIDLRTIAPLDLDAIVASVKRTRHLVVVQEAWRQFGVGAEVAASVAEVAFDYLDAPIGRVGAKPAPIPFSPVLEQHALPSQADIEMAVRATVGRAHGTALGDNAATTARATT